MCFTICKAIVPIYLILKPGYQLVLEGPEGGRTVTLVITITDQTRKILVPQIGWVSTRVIEEKEWKDGIPKETSRTFFAIDRKTKNVPARYMSCCINAWK